MQVAPEPTAAQGAPPTEAIIVVTPPPNAASDSGSVYADFEPEEIEQPPYLRVIERDDLPLLERLLKLGAPIDQRVHGAVDPPILTCLSMGSLKCAKRLLEAGANINVSSKSMGNAHQMAVLFGHDDDEALKLVESCGLKFGHPAHEAAYHGRVADLQAMSVADLEAEDSLGLISIHYAASGGHVPALRHLLERLPKGTVSLKSRFRLRAPIHCAVLRDRTEAIDFLVESGASLDELDARLDNLLILAARLGRLRSLKHLLAKKFYDLEATSGELGDTALTIAAHNGQYDVCETLLDAGADVNGRNRLGGCDKPELMRLLIKRGASLTYKVNQLGPIDCAIIGGSLRCLIALTGEYGLKLETANSPINIASSEGQIAVARWLLQRGMPVDTVEADGMNAMCYAGVSASLPMMKWLHRHGLRYDYKTPLGESLLAAGAAVNSTEIIEFLLAQGVCQVDQKDQRGMTALMVAAMRGNGAAVDCLLKHGASLLHVNIERCPTALMLCSGGLLAQAQGLYATHPGEFRRKDSKGNSALHYACVHNNGAGVVKWLLEELKLDPSPVGHAGSTPLMEAAESGDVETMKLLLDAGAKATEEDNNGSTPLLFAAFKAHLDAMKLLVSKGAKPAAVNKEFDSALTVSIKVNSLPCVRWLIEECHVDPNARFSEQNITPLMVAAFQAALPIMRYLIEVAKVNRADRDELGRTALIYAAGGNSIPCAKYLLDMGAKVKERDSNDVTAFLTAVEKGNREMAEFLISRGADPHERARDGADAVLTASWTGKLGVLKWLVQDLHLSLDTQNQGGNRPVHGAALSQDVDTLKYVLEQAPGELNVLNGNGKTPLEVAAFSASVECVKYLIARGATLTNVDSWGNTTAHLAAAGGNAACFALVLHAGAPFTDLNNEGVSVIGIAKHRGGAGMQRVYNEFLLFKAAKEGRADTVRELHQRLDLPLDITDPSGRTLLDVATHPDVLAYLRAHTSVATSAAGDGAPSGLGSFHVALLAMVALALAFARK